MTEGKPDDLNAKVDRIAADALEAGKKFAATDAGRKVGDVTDTAFATAEEMRKKVAESEFGRKTLASEPGKQAVEIVGQANDWTKSVIPNPLARSVAVGAAAGAALAIPIPGIGLVFGALVGGAIGYLRSVTKKS